MSGRRLPPSADEANEPKGFDDFDLRLGDIMRGERATLAKSLLDVQRELKIKASYIAAIENADVSAFETPGFVAGYVRSYARYLGLDPEWAFSRFCEEAGFTVSHGMSAAASGPGRSGRRKAEYSDPLANPNASFVPRGEAFLAGVQPGAIGSILVLLVLIGGLGFGGWKVLQEVQQVRLARCGGGSRSAGGWRRRFCLGAFTLGDRGHSHPWFGCGAQDRCAGPSLPAAGS